MQILCKASIIELFHEDLVERGFYMKEIIVHDDGRISLKSIEKDFNTSNSSFSSLEEVHLKGSLFKDYLKGLSSEHFKAAIGELKGNYAAYQIAFLGKNIKVIKEEEKLEKIKKSIATIPKMKDRFIAITGKRLNPGDFFYGYVLLNGEIIDIAVNIKEAVEIDGLYQIIIDEDGTVGYNI